MPTPSSIKFQKKIFEICARYAIERNQLSWFCQRQGSAIRSQKVISELVMMSHIFLLFEWRTWISQTMKTNVPLKFFISSLHNFRATKKYVELPTTMDIFLKAAMTLSIILLKLTRTQRIKQVYSSTRLSKNWFESFFVLEKIALY